MPCGLLDVSREVINAAVAALWDRLDELGERETKYAYKQVTAMMDPPAFYGDRLWRCQAEQAGRILRGQAQRKQQFALILPLLEQGMILPKTENKRAGKTAKRSKPPWPPCVKSQAMGVVLWPASSYLCLTRTFRPTARCWSLAPLPCVWLERGQGLRRGH